MKQAAWSQRRMSFEMPSGASMFSIYASLSATFTLLRQAFYQFVPVAVRNYILVLIKQWFNRQPVTSHDHFTLTIEEKDALRSNGVFEACQIYLRDKMSSSSNHLKVTSGPAEDSMTFQLDRGGNYSETYEGIKLKWSFHCPSPSPPPSVPVGNSRHPDAKASQRPSKKTAYFTLVFNKEHKEKICKGYLPFVVETSKDILREEKPLKLRDCNRGGFYDGSRQSNSVNLTHPFTFDKLAMDPEMKAMIMNDLDRFVRRKEYYRRVGKPWKRGYLLYGPPGTGKSSLIAAMANYLKFDIYDLQLGSLHGESALKDLLIWIPSKSIIVVEDIDCSRGLPNPRSRDDVTLEKSKNRSQLSMAAMLNFVDGLWSCCGDERIIVFTTNHKEKLDSALLRPGRMDMHILMSYLTMPGFKVLANNYLEVFDNHRLFGEIESLLEEVNASPAEVAEELMRSEDIDAALTGVIELLKRKKAEAEAAADLELLKEKEANTEKSGEENAMASNGALSIKKLENLPLKKKNLRI